MNYIRQYPIERMTVRLERIGDDLLVKITGGDVHHIGSVSVWSKADGLNTTLITGHRDNMVSDPVAVALGRESGATVTVICGIHYNEFSTEMRQRSIEMPDVIVRDILQYLNI